MLELDRVSKAFGGVPAVDRLELAVEAGRTVVVIGPSGCGKSTVLRLLLGLIVPDAGVVRIDGAPLEPSAVLQVRRRVGYVIQDGGLFPHLTARRNVTLMARHLRWPASRIAARLERLVDLTRFPADGLERFPIELSGGQRQRVALMRALMLDPDVLLLDEPLGALDPLIRFDLQNDLRAIFEQLGKTVVLVTHDLAEAAYFGHRIVLLRAGRKVQEGSLEDMVERPADPFVERFVRAQRTLHLEA
ncbi:MAG: ATP-binding cassette domain-containing protein [Acidobacteria bacterium]|nr:MAG: ATP-binding cassette domain-containing protein [Acidobacteriota bacterium]